MITSATKHRDDIGSNLEKDKAQLLKTDVVMK
jgi:hypothetical protein